MNFNIFPLELVGIVFCIGFILILHLHLPHKYETLATIVVLATLLSNGGDFIKFMAFIFLCVMVLIRFLYDDLDKKF